MKQSGQLFTLVCRVLCLGGVVCGKSLLGVEGGVGCS